MNTIHLESNSAHLFLVSKKKRQFIRIKSFQKKRVSRDAGSTCRIILGFVSGWDHPHSFISHGVKGHSERVGTQPDPERGLTLQWLLNTESNPVRSMGLVYLPTFG